MIPKNFLALKKVVVNKKQVKLTAFIQERLSARGAALVTNLAIIFLDLGPEVFEMTP